MCGFVGIVSNNVSSQKDWLTQANDSLYHRGPDDSGIFISNNNKVGLGHRRLSIIDTSNYGHQPMKVDNLTIVFNGEIYNFQDLREGFFKDGIHLESSSDTEVLLYAYKKWGEKCLKYLNGMFSFVIFDSIKNNLFIARDRVGEKPFFYMYNKEKREFLFASELKALLSKEDIDKTLNIESMNCYLDMGFIPSNRSILNGFSKLPAAHCATLDIEKFTLNVKRYWKAPAYESTKRVDDDVLLDEMESILEDSVKKQLVSDVPIGVLLSGGVDSSIITGLASRSTDNLKTFFIGFNEFQEYDESPYAQLVADYFKTEHITLNASEVKPDILLDLAKQYDEPIVDSSMVPTYLVSKLVSQHCKVVLGGDGADELFGGYTHYSRMLWLEDKFKRFPQFSRNLASKLTKYILPTGFKGKNWLSSLGIDFELEVPKIARYFDDIEKKKLLGSLGQSEYIEDRYNEYASSQDLLQRATRMDFENYLVEDILVKVDRASMLNSLEVRAPFLDYRLIEFAFKKIPSDLKATTNTRKVLLKKLAHKILPKEFDFQRKQGFSIPLEHWLKKGEWKDFFYDVLLSQDATFNRTYVKDLLKGQSVGRNNSERLFALVMFELWKKEYDIK